MLKHSQELTVLTVNCSAMFNLAPQAFKYSPFDPEIPDDYEQEFSKINRSLMALLRKAQALYENLGVQYEVISLHNSLFRQIVPYELLVHLGLVNFTHLFNDDQQKK